MFTYALYLHFSGNMMYEFLLFNRQCPLPDVCLESMTFQFEVSSHSVTITPNMSELRSTPFDKPWLIPLCVAFKRDIITIDILYKIFVLCICLGSRSGQNMYEGSLAQILVLSKHRNTMFCKLWVLLFCFLWNWLTDHWWLYQVIYVVFIPCK